MAWVVCCCGEQVSDTSATCDDCVWLGCHFGFCNRIEQEAVNL